MTCEIAKVHGVFEKPTDIAIDLTEWMYYRNPNDSYVVGTKHKNGTNLCYRFATVNIVEKGRRFTIYAIPMSQFTSKETSLRRLIEYARTKVKIKTVYVDRGFFNCKAINLLNEMGLKFLMPAIKNRRIMELADEFNSPKVIEYKMGVIRGRKGKKKFREDTSIFNLVIVKDKNGIKRTFATNLDVGDNDAFGLFELYSKRWGIETSYRVKGEFKAKTTSKNYAVRLFYFLFSVCLYNLWVLVNIIVGLLMLSKIVMKPMISAKIFGTLLYTTFYIDDGG